METKLSKLTAHAKAGEWREALRIAARFPQLGDESAAIKRAHEAFQNGHFYRQIGKDPDALIAEGIAALQSRYKLKTLIGDSDMTALTATAIDTLTTAVSGATVKRASSKDAAIKRFVAAAEAKGITPDAVAAPLAEANLADAKRILEVVMGIAGTPPAVEAPHAAKPLTLDQRDKAAAQAWKADGTTPNGYETNEGDLIRRKQTDDGPVVIVVAKGRIERAAKPAKAAPVAGARAAALAAAQAGTIPDAPDMRAPSHKPFLKALATVKALVDARDLAGLKAHPMEPKSSSRVMICRYRDHAIIAIEAQQSGVAA